MKSAVTARDFNTTLSAIRRYRQKRDLGDVNLQVSSIHQLELSDVYSTPHPAMVEYPFFPTICEVFTKTEQC